MWKKELMREKEKRISYFSELKAMQIVKNEEI